MTNLNPRLAEAAERLATAVVSRYPDIDGEVLDGAVLRCLTVVADLMERGDDDIRFVGLRAGQVAGWRALLVRDDGVPLPRIDVQVVA